MSLEILPREPIVILGDVKDMNGNQLRGPWFALQMALSNSFSETVHVDRLKFSVVHWVNGIKQPAIVRTFSPEDFDYEAKCGGVRVPFFYIDFGKFAPGQTERLHLTNRGNPIPEECGGQDAADRTPIFYIGDLPRLGTGARYEYEVSGIVSGWFEVAGKPTTRFQKVINFKTK